MRMTVLLAALFAFIAVGTLRADDDQGKKRGERGDRDGHRAEILKKFDKDNSGDLNEEERATARAAFEARRAEGGDKGEGREARGEGREGRRGGFDRAAMMKKFDKDESGDLNEEERAELRKHFEEMRAKFGNREGQRRGPPGFDREKIIAEFDKDKDGKLSEEERTTAREAMKKRFEEMRKNREGEGRRDGDRKREGRPERKDRPAD